MNAHAGGEVSARGKTYERYLVNVHKPILGIGSYGGECRRYFELRRGKNALFPTEYSSVNA